MVKKKEEKVEYVVRLTYAKKMKRGPLQYDAKIANFFARYPQKGTDTVFYGDVVLRARVIEKTFKKFLMAQGFKLKDGLYITTDSEKFYRAIVYASLMQCTRHDAGWDLVENLPYIHVKYWSSVLSEYYMRRGWRKDLYRPVKAFREVYELE
jgi:hypothetical protein